MIGLVELIGVGPALANIGAIPYSKSVTFVLGLLPIFILIDFGLPSWNDKTTI